MRITNLKLINFRNYDNLEINFNKNINIFIGNNAQGKSNVLEAIQTLGTLVLRPVHATKQNGSADYKFNRYPVKPFMLSEEGINNPTEFEIFFRTRVAEYKYALHIQNGVVVNESLDRVKLDTNRRSAKDYQEICLCFPIWGLPIWIMML